VRAAAGPTQRLGRDGRAHARAAHDDHRRRLGDLVQAGTELVQGDVAGPVDALALELEPAPYIEQERHRASRQEKLSLAGVMLAASASPRLWRMMAAMFAGAGASPDSRATSAALALTEQLVSAPSHLRWW
jgi:hypothetical protein